MVQHRPIEEMGPARPWTRKRKVFSVLVVAVNGQSKWCKSIFKMHQNTFGGSTSPGPSDGGGGYALPDSLAA